MTAQRRMDPELWLVDAAGDLAMPVYPLSAACGHDKRMKGACDLTLPADDEAVEVFMGASLGSEFPEVSARIYARGTNVWSGPVTSCEVSHKGSARSGLVQVSLEHFYGYFARLRMIAGDVGLASMDKTTDLDNLVLRVMRENIGGVGGAGLITPTSYPGTRNDFGSFLPEVVNDHSPAQHPTSARRVVQSGNNVGAFLDHMLEDATLAPVFTDSLDQTFDMDVDYPFEDQDLSTSVIFGEWHGNLQDFKLISDRSGMANTWGVEGGTTATRSWAESTASVTAWGRFEAFAQKPQDAGLGTPVGDTAVEAAYLAALYGPAKVTYTATLLDTPGHVWITDYFWRDKITLDIDTFGMAIQATVNFWNMKWDDSGMYSVGVGLGTPSRQSAADFVAGYAGRPGTGFAGSRWRNKRQ